MSKDVFEDGDPGNLPVLIDVDKGGLMPVDSIEVQTMRWVFLNQTTLDERRAWHAVTCKNSRHPDDMATFSKLSKRMEEAVKAAVGRNENKK